MRIALRTQQVIAHETGVVNTIDPLGGSYYVEHLTNELERQAYEYFERIERARRRASPAIEQNFFQREIAEAAFRYQREVESGRARRRRRQPLRGSSDETEPALLRIDPALERAAGRARRGAAGAARRGRGRGGARAAARGRGARRREPDAGDRRRGARVRDDGRDVRRAPRGLGRLARDAGLLDGCPCRRFAADCLVRS